MIALSNPRETVDRLEKHKDKMKSKNYLKEVGYVCSIQEESGRLGERPNESDKSNLTDKKSNMQNYKNTIAGKALLILCKGILFNSCGKLLFIPKKGTVRANKNNSGASCLTLRSGE